MNVQRWHWGKIVIIWAWGGLIAALLLTEFVSQAAHASPLVASMTFLIAILLLGGLTVVTWIWLGGKDHASTER